MKKLNKKGFTLIELLAVIVVLAIIIVIAVPSVLNVQKSAKQGATRDEALLLVKSIELCISSEQNLSKCSATDSLANSAPGFADNGGPTNAKTSIGKYYEKGIGSNKYVLTGSVDAPTIKGLEYTSNGYKVSVSAEQTLNAMKTSIQNATPVAAP